MMKKNFTVLLVLVFMATFAFAQAPEKTQNAISYEASAINLEEGFENTFLPTDWSKVVTTGNDITQNTDKMHTGSYSARFGSYNISTDYNQYLFSPLTTIAAGDFLSFWTAKYEMSAEVFEYGIATDISDPTSITWTAVTLGTDWSKSSVDLSAYVGQDV